MKRKTEQVILVNFPKVTDLLKRLFEKGGELLPQINIPNLANYSTKFENIR